MALTSATKTLVDALVTTPDSAANALAHGGDHKTLHAAMKEIYGIRRYKVLLTQSGTSAPTATVLENTFTTTPTWTRVSQGNYRLTFGSGEASASKRFVTTPNACLNSSTLVSFYCVLYESSTDDIVDIGTTVSGSADSCLLNHPFEVEVYP